MSDDTWVNKALDVDRIALDLLRSDTISLPPEDPRVAVYEGLTPHQIARIKDALDDEARGLRSGDVVDAIERYRSAIEAVINDVLIEIVAEEEEE